jgi:hypothetical protein
MGEIAAADSIRNILAGLQADAGGYLISATLAGGDYDVGDFAKDFLVNAAITTAAIAAPFVVGEIWRRIGGDGTLQHASRLSLEVLPPKGGISKDELQVVGRAILNNPVTSRSLSQIQGMNGSIKLNYQSKPLRILGRTQQGHDHAVRVDVFMRNQSSVQSTLETIAHESSHAQRMYRGTFQNTRYEEYLAFRREALVKYGRRPTAAERKELWNVVNQLYPELPVGKVPNFVGR